MKRFLSLALLTIVMMVSMPQKSHAIVGIVISKNVVKVVGGATVGAGAVSLAIGSYVGAHSSAWLAGLGWILGGLAFGGLGIIILDDDTAEFQFPVLTTDKADELAITENDMEIYNSEVNKLNRVKELIEENITNEDSIEDVRNVWLDSCSQFLTETTCSVKGIIANEVMKNLKVIK